MLSKQLVKAVSALHTPIDDKLVIHHDIKISNILIQINWNNEPILKLADFGCAIKIGKNERIQNQHSGTENILAPEVFGWHKNGFKSYNGYNEKSDIWSVGCTVLQMIYNDIQKPKPVCIFKPAAPTFPDSIDDELKEFLNGCFKINDKERLSIFKLAEQNI